MNIDIYEIAKENPNVSITVSAADLQRFAERIIEETTEKAKKTASDLLTKKQVREIFHVNDATIWRWEQEGRLKRWGNAGRKVYYRVSDVQRAFETSKD